MALTRSQVFKLYGQKINKDLLAARLLQLYNFLTTTQKNTVWPVIESDLAAVLNAEKASQQAAQTEYNAEANATIAGIDTTVADVLALVP